MQDQPGGNGAFFLNLISNQIERGCGNTHTLQQARQTQRCQCVKWVYLDSLEQPNPPFPKQTNPTTAQGSWDSLKLFPGKMKRLFQYFFCYFFQLGVFIKFHEQLFHVVGDIARHQVDKDNSWSWLVRFLSCFRCRSIKTCSCKISLAFFLSLPFCSRH